MAEPLVVQQPASAQQLFLLAHGVGALPQDMVPLGRRLGATFSQACVVSLAGPQPAPFGAAGRQWFSPRGIDDANRPARIRAAWPVFEQMVRAWQARTGVGPEATALIGFSQGGAMALEASCQAAPVAGRVVGIGARYGTLPAAAPAGITVHLLHGKQDTQVPYAHAVRAAEHLVALGADVTADVVPFVGHELNDELATLLVERLTTYVPKRLWEQALQAAARWGRVRSGD
jgi:phospholipase/carboxylesterase